jgi:hypothetical protein
MEIENYILTSTKFEGSRLRDLPAEDLQILFCYRPSDADREGIREFRRFKRYSARVTNRPQRADVFQRYPVAA